MERGRNPGLRLRLASAVGLILLALVATGCGLTRTTTPRASDQWSNGKLLGTAILKNRVALQVDGAGNSFMVWIGPEHELLFARLNERAEVVVQAPLDLHSTSPMKPQLLMDTTGQLHLTWLDKQELTMQLFYARLSANGEVLQEATVLSPPERRLPMPCVIASPTRLLCTANPSGVGQDVPARGLNCSRPLLTLHRTACKICGSLVSYDLGLH